MRIIKNITLCTLAISSCLSLSTYADTGTWSHSFYGGLGAGLQSESFDTQVNGMLLNFNYNSSHQFNNNATNGLANAFVGFANTNGSLYWALEGNIYYSNNSDSTQYIDAQEGVPLSYNNLQSQMKWRYELDFILGHFFTPQWLGYAKIGATTGELENQFTAYNSAQNLFANPSSMNSWAYGGVVGLGAQYYLSSHWRIGAEADYMQFAKTNANTSSLYYSGVQPVPTSFSTSSRPDGYLLKAMVSYVF